jgi:hypothetical protein
MKPITWIIPLSLLAWGWLFLLPPPAAAMDCTECHADVQGGGGFHGSFRNLTTLTKDQVDVVCMSCHNGTYTNPGGTTAPEAMVHEQPVGARNLEYGSFKAGCLDCHRTHPTEGGLAGDGSLNTNLRLIGREVVEASSTDGVARIRKPIIDAGTDPDDPSDDTQHGNWECDSGIPDDPACVESDPPAAGDDVRKVAFYGNLYEGGSWPGNGGRNPWADDVAPYNGACNGCHTRTAHHRRDDSGGDHTHKITNLGCVACHDHDAGWLNKGG